VEHNGEQRHRARGTEAAAPRLLEITFVDRLSRAHADVGGQHFRRLQIHRGADAADEEAHAGQRGDRDREREQQHAQLAGAPFAAEGPHRQSQCPHYVVSSWRKPMRKCATIAPSRDRWRC
jgi:hypothetical protein